MPQFPLCSEFIPVLDSFKNQLAELKDLSQEFLSSGDKSKKEEFDQIYQKLEITKQQLIDLKEQPVDFEGNAIPRIEKELLMFFRRQLGDDLKYKISGNDVSEIGISDSKKPAVILKECLRYLKLFDSLQGLYCYNTQITSLPELPDSLQWLECHNTQITSLPELPDSLQWLECHNTPAAKKSETRQQLEEFKKSHPQFNYQI